MKTIYKVLIPATLIFGMQKCNQLSTDAREIFAVFRSGSPFLSVLSYSWSYEALTQLIDSDALKGKEDSYRYMLERAAPLGRWKGTCEHVEKKSLGHSWEIKKVSLKAICQFDHGEAEVTFVAYEKPKFIGFNVEKSYSPTKT